MDWTCKKNLEREKNLSYHSVKAHREPDNQFSNPMPLASFFISGVFILDARPGILAVCKHGIFYKLFRVAGVSSRNLKYSLPKLTSSLHKLSRKPYLVWNTVENSDF